MADEHALAQELIEQSEIIDAIINTYPSLVNLADAAECMRKAASMIATWNTRHQPNGRAGSGDAVGGFVVANGQETAWRMWGQTGPEWTTDRDAAMRFARRCDAESFSAEDEDAWLIRQVGSPALAINGRTATHFCNVCGALWAEYPQYWSLVSAHCGKCCDNAPMNGQIVRIATARAGADELIAAAKEFPREPNPYTYRIAYAKLQKVIALIDANKNGGST